MNLTKIKKMLNDIKLKWVAAQIKPNMIKQVENHLTKQCFEFFAPRRQETVRYGNLFRKIHKIDISNNAKVKKFFKQNKKYNYIIHTAAHFANQNSVDHPISDMKTNILGIINLLGQRRSII